MTFQALYSRETLCVNSVRLFMIRILVIYAHTFSVYINCQLLYLFGYKPILAISRDPKFSRKKLTWSTRIVNA